MSARPPSAEDEGEELSELRSSPEEKSFSSDDLWLASGRLDQKGIAGR